MAVPAGRILQSGPGQDEKQRATFLTALALHRNPNPLPPCSADGLRACGDLTPHTVYGFPPPFLWEKLTSPQRLLPPSLPPSAAPLGIPSPPPQNRHTHALAGRHKGFKSRPLCPPTAARAAPAPALARQGRVFFGSQRPPLLSISYGTPPGFKADSSGKAGEMNPNPPHC